MAIEDKFQAAVEIINSLPQNGPFQPSDDMVLKFYAYQKQATEGPCSIPKPSFWDVAARNKWSAWNALGNMPKQVAMENYVEELTKVIETMSYSEKVSKFVSLLGPFYEAVLSEEGDACSEKSGQSKTASEREAKSNPKTTYESFRFAQHISKEHFEIGSGPLRRPEVNRVYDSFNYAQGIHDDDSTSSSEISSRDSLDDCENELNASEVPRDDIPGVLTERDVIAIFKSNQVPHTLPSLTPKDLLMLTITNMEHSLEGMCTQLEKMHALAKTEHPTRPPREDGSAGWNLTFSGTFFALLWPLAVQMFLNDFWH